MPVSGRIQFELQRLLDANQCVQVLCFYQEYPVITRARLLELRDGRLSLRVEAPGSVCLTWEQSSWLLLGEPLEALRARVASFSLVSGLVVLHDFSYVGSKFGRRMIVRVAPKEPVAVDLSTEEQHFVAEMANLTINGAGLRLARKDVALSENQVVRLTLHLAGGTVEAMGQVREIIPLPAGLRLSVVFTSEPTHKGVLLRYIAERRIEITNELRQLYEDAVRRKGSAPHPPSGVL